jgi:CubicO group peptidase (beta-lactamase class C family)
MPNRRLVVIFVSLVLAVAACSSPPDPATIDALTAGIWHGSVGPEDYLYVITYDNGTFGGSVHRVIDGRQVVEVPVMDVTLSGADIEIRLVSLPPYEGQLDLTTGRIEGGHPIAPAYADLDLTRVDRADWPAAYARAGVATGEAAYAWSPPAEREDGWAVSAPEDVGIDTEAVESLVDAIIAGEAGALHSLLLIRDGKLIVEEYFHGWSVDDLHRLASVTKSVDSLLVGIAIDRGEINGVEVPILELLPERAASTGSGWEQLRLEHLLTMSMGLDWNDSEAERFARPGEDRIADILARNVSTEPGAEWRYVSRNTNLLSDILLQATGVHADLFAAEYLFAPLGITTWDWESNKYEGHPGMSGTLMMRPRDMAKLGQLVLNEGSWEGQTVVSPGWIRESSRVRMTPPDADGYGYLWWMFDEPAPGGIVYANGMGSQFIAGVPDFDLVLVTTGGNDYNGMMHAAIFEVARRTLLPGIETRH